MPFRVCSVLCAVVGLLLGQTHAAVSIAECDNDKKELDFDVRTKSSLTLTCNDITTNRNTWDVFDITDRNDNLFSSSCYYSRDPVSCGDPDRQNFSPNRAVFHTSVLTINSNARKLATVLLVRCTEVQGTNAKSEATCSVKFVSSPAGLPQLGADCPTSVTRGSTVRCTCRAVPATPPAIVQWVRVPGDISQGRSEVLEIPNIQQSETYSCRQYWDGWGDTVYYYNVYAVRVTEPAPIATPSPSTITTTPTTTTTTTRKTTTTTKSSPQVRISNGQTVISTTEVSPEEGNDIKTNNDNNNNNGEASLPIIIVAAVGWVIIIIFIIVVIVIVKRRRADVSGQVNPRSAEVEMVPVYSRIDQDVHHYLSLPPNRHTPTHGDDDEGAYLEVIDSNAESRPKSNIYEIPSNAPPDYLHPMPSAQERPLSPSNA